MTHVDGSSSHGTGTAQGDEDLPEPLALIRLALQSSASAKERYPDFRLTKLVAARLDLDERDIARFAELLDFGSRFDVSGTARPFDQHLRRVISTHCLEALFCADGPGLYHHAIRPTGYDFARDEVIPIGMECWRADYRGMSDERQMLAASIIWLYRAGKDNVWLRRVPCTWHAADAIACLRSRGALDDWAQLFALYPGW